MLGVPACVVGVVAHHALQPALDGAYDSVSLAVDVDAADVVLPLQHVVAIGCETRLRQAFAGARQCCVIKEDADDVPARIRESVASAGIASHVVRHAEATST